MSENKKSRREDIGVLWVKYDKFRKEFFVGNIEIDGVKTSIVIFENTLKREDKHPDFVIRKNQIKR